MNKYDVLAMGDVCVDILLNKIQDFPKIASEIIAEEMHMAIGGSAAIFSCNLSTLGTSVQFLSAIGKDKFGEFIDQELQKRSVARNAITWCDDCMTACTVALSYGNERAMVTHLGSMDELSSKDLTDSLLQNARHLHVSSVFLQRKMKLGVLEIFQRAKDLGLSTSLDTQWDPEEKWDLDFDRILPLVDVFLPNKDELLAITKQQSPEEALAWLQNKANLVIAKLGAEGSMALIKGEIHFEPSFLNSSVADAIGAGDSFDAGFIHKFLLGESIQDCMRFANLCGAINTTYAGGTDAFKSKDRVRELAFSKFGTCID